MTGIDDQQFCLRWNNFQSYITSQFEALRDDEDFVDVTLACEGQRLGAHKVVLSACSPFFKELFKSNPCRHPIVFMRDVEVRHVVALLEFMYAGEVNVAQKNLAGFLKTAESLQIRGLTDATKNKKTTSDVKGPTEAQPTSSQTPSSPTPEPRATQTSSTTLKTRLSPSRTVTSSQEKSPASPVEPPRKKHCKADPIDSVEASLIGTTTVVKADIDTSDTNSNIAKSDLAQINPFAIETKKGLHSEIDISTDLIEPKLELPDYSEDDELTNQDTANFMDTDQQNAFANLAGGMQIIPGTSGMGDISQESDQAWDNRKLHSLDPRPCPVCDRVYSNLSNLRQHIRLIHNPTHVECPSCAKSFKTTLYLKRHLVGCRGNNDTAKLNINYKLTESRIVHSDKIATRSMSKRDESNAYFNTSPAKCKRIDDDLHLDTKSDASHQKNAFYRTGEIFNSETSCFEHSDKYSTSYNSDDAIDNITV